jgi:bifunctional ADP-heptose synthase (sugar kinase/adenylyltransferase)
MINKEIENSDKEIEKYWIDFVKNMNTNVVITRWSKWASLITKDGKCFHLETEAKKVFDVSGAWDTFIATIAYALANNYDLINAVKLANKASWIVVEKVGTAVIKYDELFN